MAVTFAGPDLPVPEVREVGSAPIRTRLCHLGASSRAVPGGHPGGAGRRHRSCPYPACSSPFTACRPDRIPRWSGIREPASVASWREYLLDGLVDDPGKLVHGWSAALAANPELAALSAAVTETGADPGGGLSRSAGTWSTAISLHGNVLVSPDARRVEAVLSWKCSVRGLTRCLQRMKPLS